MNSVSKKLSDRRTTVPNGSHGYSWSVRTACSTATRGDENEQELRCHEHEILELEERVQERIVGVLV